MLPSIECHNTIPLPPPAAPHPKPGLIKRVCVRDNSCVARLVGIESPSSFWFPGLSFKSNCRSDPAVKPHRSLTPLKLSQLLAFALQKFVHLCIILLIILMSVGLRSRNIDKNTQGYQTHLSTQFEACPPDNLYLYSGQT